MPTCMVPWTGNRKTIAIGCGAVELVAISPLVFGREWIFSVGYRTDKQVLEHLKASADGFLQVVSVLELRFY